MASNEEKYLRQLGLGSTRHGHLVGLRVSSEHELLGLDLSQHGEVGYDFES